MLTSTTLQEEPAEVAKYVKVTTKPIETMEPAPAIRKFKWYKSSKGPEQATPVQSATASSTAKQQAALAPPLGHSKGRVSVDESAGGARSGREHVFQPHGISPLRYTRCDHCGDKMWGPITELRCARK
jgi:Rho-type GTPase-activating protein 1/2